MTSTGALDHVLGNVLGYPDDHQVRLSLDYLGVHDIHSLTFFRGDEFSLPYFIPDPDDPASLVETRLVALHSKRLAAIVDWYYAQEHQQLNIWFPLTADTFQAWYDQSQRPPTIHETTTQPKHTPFRNTIKITLADYPKLKEDKQWRSYNRLLKATADNHDTLQVLDPTFIPTPAQKEVFLQKQSFMYHVFSQTLSTSKGRLCVRNFESTRDAQSVYASLYDAYNDELSTSLLATSLRT
jgi:hypothetical protein